MIYTTINTGSQLQEEFKKFSDRGDTFTPAGYDAIFDYLEESGEDIELDVIALCCDFCEFGTAKEAMEDYAPDELAEFIADHSDEDKIEELCAEYIQENYSVIVTRNDTYIVSA
jgi:hypothetical protein